jgi:hypothetical protein
MRGCTPWWNGNRTVSENQVLLFRGDRSPEAKLWRTDGIMSRLMMGGKDGTVALLGFWEAARVHVKHDADWEKLFYASTPLLSFSEKIDRAGLFALGRDGKGELHPHDEPYGEDTTIFELSTAGMVNDGEAGLFVLDYTCDYSLAVPHGEGPEHSLEGTNLGCEFCSLGNKVPFPRVNGEGELLHRIQLINVPVFLGAHPDREHYAGALATAQRDREWLIYPLDFISRLRGNASRVPLSRIWSARRFKVVDPDAPPPPPPPSRIILP